MKSALLTFSLAALALTPSSHAAWQRLGISDRQLDTASASVTGSTISSSKGIGQPENLLADDVSVNSKLSAGQSEVVVAIGRVTIVSQVSLVNEGCEGRVSVEGSVDKNKWASLGQQVFSGSDRGLRLQFAGATVSYIKLSFDLSKAGTAKALAFYGSASDRDYQLKDEPSSTSTVNIAEGVGGGRVIYMNPSPSRYEDLSTGRFEFPESPDKYRTVIYDFGKARTLTSVGSVHSPRPVRMYAYTFENELPEKEDWRGRKSFDPVVFDGMKPVATVEDARGVGFVKTRLAKSVRCRYLALRWEPDYNPPAFTVYSTDVEVSGVRVQQINNNNGGGGGNGGGSVGGTDGTENPQGNGSGSTAFTNPFALGTGGYGSPGRAPTTNPGTARGAFDAFASP